MSWDEAVKQYRAEGVAPHLARCSALPSCPAMEATGKYDVDSYTSRCGACGLSLKSIIETFREPCAPLGEQSLAPLARDMVVNHAGTRKNTLMFCQLCHGGGCGTCSATGLVARPRVMWPEGATEDATWAQAVKQYREKAGVTGARECMAAYAVATLADAGCPRCFARMECREAVAVCLTCGHEETGS